MRIAIVSDVHGNLIALEAVLEDLERQRPDLVVHGGDLAFNGPRPAECVERVRQLGWPGVRGNMDEALETHRGRHPSIDWAREQLGEEPNRWLQGLALEWRHDDEIALVHAVPGDLWKAVGREADDAQLREVYGPLGARLAVYGHIHRPYVRDLGALTVANTGSVGLPFDGDPRASYLLVSDGRPEVRRVAYDVERAVRDVEVSGHPGAPTVAGIYRSATPPA
ncbi:MAG: YfcE family phosphodiesterase [Candidatus Nephthysia bennettiae]|uniref:Phosphoesterase n=1 Tax=Candidatus Nephthysia bennettiae TaxID=3127016 RepID=A0A934K544_9BACT|nr:metallophosphoesterase family protein [Candidatus Dormibacteraeota bacterium]MBJ7615066.1 metallophosphoesterase family protein [Candidatus Dormibacteraeota bacterium]PZS00046.1 MAG: YfcE family phosphodiesterase [Candidatus Dormibacteraeota bacterium]